VSAHRAVYSIAAMCRVLGVSSSGYYAWAKRVPSARATSDAALIGRIGAIHAASHGTYGSPRVHAELTESGLRVNRKRVARLMKTAGLAGVSRRRFVTTTVRDGSRQAPDLVERAFKAEAPNMLWVADITYIPTWSGFLYLAIVLDVFSRRIVGWSMSLTLHTHVVLAALNMALAVRRPENVIHHSDQGSQYTSIAFGKRCREAGVRPSMGSVGDAYDNAMAESFFATLECELLERRRFKTQAEARMAVFAFIEGFYNPRRRHSALGYLSPIAFERQHTLMAEQRSASSPGEPNHAAVLAPIKHKPCRARKLRVLDRDCARQQSLCMGRGEGTASAAAEQRNWIEKEDDTLPAAQIT
jgi:putative transposase